jgi:hypothetical protein
VVGADLMIPISWSNHHSWTLLKCGHSLCTNTCTSGNTTLVPFLMNSGFHSLMSGDNSYSINIPSGLTPEVKSSLYLCIVEVLAMLGLYQQIQE